jgi:DegV family protein with EDD domain
MSIRIVTDSTSDLPESLAQKYNIKVAPLRVNFGEVSYLDGVELKTKDFYKKLAESKELPSTSQVNPGEFENIFNEILAQGDEIIGIFIAKELSGTYASAKIAKDMLGSEKIHLVDSRGVTAIMSILVIEASRMANKGFSAQEIVSRIENMAENMKSAFLIDTLTYLVKGGRLSKTQGFAGSLLNIKPIIQVKDGVVETIQKARGRAKGIKWIIDNLKEGGYDLSNKTVFVVNSNDLDLGEKIKEALLEDFQVGELLEAQIGSVVGTHAGPGCGGIVFCEID